VRAPVLLAVIFACDHEPPSQRTAPSAIPAEATRACFELVVDVVLDGLWLTAPGDARCYAPRTGGNHDLVWLARELRALLARVPPGCAPSAKVRGDTSIAIEDLGAVTDVFSDAGLMDFGYVPRRFALDVPVLPPRSCSGGP
jgi:hypothetical protein